MRIFNTVYKVCLKREFLGSNNLKMVFISCAWSYVQNMRKNSGIIWSICSFCVCLRWTAYACMHIRVFFVYPRVFTVQMGLCGFVCVGASFSGQTCTYIFLRVFVYVCVCTLWSRKALINILKSSYISLV